MKLTIPLLTLLLVVVAGCGSTLDAARGSVEPTPTDFAGLVKALSEQELTVADVVSGDPGCANQELVPMAISFDLAGAGIPAAVHARVYRFANKESYDKLRQLVDACAAEWIGDPSTLLMVDASPYVLVTEGIPEGAAADAIRAALSEAAGE
jgi:hypothetical protein